MNLRTVMASNDVLMKRASGNAPDFGAIFMSNKTTLEECFKRKLFGLPHGFFNFVKEVKAGTVLFLFEFEQRQLYGVFQAVTDGTMNIVPHAYRSSGKVFPAQVRFSVIWNCRPLLEHEFCDAIKDNYFAATKFNFGLSKDQVQRLLFLFYSRKVVQRSLKKKNVKSLDIVNPLVDSGKLEPERDDSMVESQARNARISFSQRPFMSGTSKKLTSEHEYATHSTDASASSSLSGSQSVALQKEHIDISSYNASSGLGDYIPLSSPEHFDPTENGEAFSNAGVLKGNQIESATFSEACILPVPYGLMDSNQPSSVLGQERDQCDGYYQSFPVHQDEYPRVRGLYADTQDKRTSVFSRLNLVSKAAVEENEDKSEVTGSVHEIMEKLQQSHENWKRTTNLVSKAAVEENEDKSEATGSVHEIMEKLQQSHENWKRTRKTESISLEKGDSHLKKRASVFSRLNFASKDAVEEKEVNTQVDKFARRTAEIFQGNKRKRGREVAIRSHDGENFYMTIQVPMREDASQFEEDPDNHKGEMLKIDCETEGRDGVDGGVGGCLSEEQQKRGSVRLMLGNKSDVTTDDNQTGLSQNDIKPAVIYPTNSDGNGEEQRKGLTNMDSMDGPKKSCFREVGTKPLNVYQHRRLSASASVKDLDKEVLFVDERQAECTENFFGAGREEHGQQDAGIVLHL